MLNAWSLMALFTCAALLFARALLLFHRCPPETFAPRASGPRAPELHLAHAEDGERSTEMRRQLFQAGFDHPSAVTYFTYSKVICALCLLLAALLLIRHAPALSNQPQLSKLGILCLGFVCGYFLPVTFIDRRRKAWLTRIQRALPDALDFMLICVEAGQSTDVAIKRVADELAPVHPELAARFLALTEALAAGADRHEAWLKLAQITGNDDLRQLAGIILQSASMGTPIAQTLRVFAADLRDQRVRRVEERANVLPTKMTLGTMMFTVPPLLILLLAPAIYRIATSI